LALGYLTGKASSKALGTNINIPLALTLSVLPDIDLFMEPMLRHGGPTHSLVILTALFLPVILIWKKASIPYLAAAASHALIGDYLTRSANTRGVQLLFPLTRTWYSAGLEEAELLYIYSEIILLIVFLSLLFTTKDTNFLTKNHRSNWLLVIPVITLVLPLLIDFPLYVPIELVIPHLALIAMLMLPILVDANHLICHPAHRHQQRSSVQSKDT
jgi:membrane-bound metal-dependent hydrolase YbcI (DUF457 family)